MNGVRPRHWIAASCFGVTAFLLWEIAVAMVSVVAKDGPLDERVREPTLWIGNVFLACMGILFASVGWRLLNSPIRSHFKLASALLAGLGLMFGIPWTGWLEWPGAEQVLSSGMTLVAFVVANRIWALVCAWGIRSEGIEVGRFEFMGRPFLFFAALLLWLFLADTADWLDSHGGAVLWSEPVQQMLWRTARTFGPLVVAILFYNMAASLLIRRGACWA